MEARSGPELALPTEPGPSAWGNRRRCRAPRGRVAKYTGPVHAALPGAESSRRNPAPASIHGAWSNHAAWIHRASSWSPTPARSQVAPCTRSRRVLPVCAPDTSADHDRIKNSQPSFIWTPARIDLPQDKNAKVRLVGQFDPAIEIIHSAMDDDSPAKIPTHSGFNSPSAAYCGTTARRKLRTPITNQDTRTFCHP